MITNQMKVLNDAFGGVAPSFPNCNGASQPAGTATPFRFTHVQTIRTQNDSWFSSSFSNMQTIMQGNRIGTCSDLNLIIKDSSNLGVATLPSGECAYDLFSMTKSKLALRSLNICMHFIIH